MGLESLIREVYILETETTENKKEYHKEGGGVLMNKKQSILLQEAKNRVEKSYFPFYSVLMIFTSIFYGVYIYLNNGYVVNTIDQHFNFITEGVLSVLTIMSGIALVIGLLSKNGHVRRFGVVLMSFTWGLIFMLALIWSLNAGYPDPNFIIYGQFLLLCLIASYKGDFH